jgi:hypothetical protein
MLYDFYYSKTFENKLKILPNYTVSNVLINGTYFVYTECIEHGHTPLAYKREDTARLGSAKLSDVKIGDIGGKRMTLYRVEKPCHGICQLCFSDDCYTNEWRRE